MLLCHEQVTASSATMRSLTSSCARRMVAFSFSAAGHDGMPICHLRALIHNMCGGNSTLAAWEVASRAQTAGSPVTGRSKIFPSSVTSTVEQGVADQPLLSSPEFTGIERWSDISMYPCFSYMFRAPRRANRCSSWAGPGTTWNSHAASIEHRNSSPTCPFFNVCEGIY